ncbi:hypothetical protein AJ80_08929 [Polytolypa hystricis UAMH7299]|uniref:Septin-type G domain-containing protein n=1 Tax=Polytolypa hystricis (strain UAMH7299) TaxID=1447883 RepID=A0A2B7WZC6_POLH7|nr:hypothetical protein AJ80_08929 [Polytolypa hystricis UAMH7299]
MRPVVAEPFLSPPRKTSTGAGGSSTPSTDPGLAAPEMFFLARDGDMESSQSNTLDGQRDSTYGVQSLEETIETVDTYGSTARPEELQPSRDKEPEGRTSSPSPFRRTTAIKQGSHLEAAYEPTEPRQKRNRSVSSSSNLPPSLPLTPLILGSPAEPASLPSSPKSTSTRSFRPSDEISIPDEAGDHANVSSDEEHAAESSEIRDSTPQLIMPSIKMPSRRPFTDRGKAMGRFKILVAGAPGSGKTSLLKSIVQMCEDIVHVDPLPRSSTIPRSSRANPSRHKQSNRYAAPAERVLVEEIYASTKPYPSWWTDLEDSRVLRRRKSSGEIVLERNLCFVDLHSGVASKSDQTDLIVQYINQQMQRTLNAAGSMNTDLQGLLSGNGGSQVDLILYLVSEETLSHDVEFIRKLLDFSNVIPLIAKSDLLSPEHILSLKESFSEKATGAGFRPFSFGAPIDTAENGPERVPPFSISSANANDDENMDASLLMSADYVQPLFPSDLTFLLEKIFDLDNLVWMRHSAARKLVQSYRPPRTISAAPAPSPAGFASFRFERFDTPQLSSPSASQVLVSHPSDRSSPGYALARVADHTKREEQLAQVRLAKWASDLQQSLQNERERYEALARNERAVWLTERLSECVTDGTLLPISQTPGFSGFEGTPYEDKRDLTLRAADGRRFKYRIAHPAPHDPLGLIRWNDDLKRRGWVIVQVIGSVGVVGGLALWVAKAWGFTSHNLTEWTVGWIGGE